MLTYVISPLFRIGARTATTALSPQQLPFTLLGGFVAMLALVVIAFGRVPGDIAVSQAFWSFERAWLEELMLFGDTIGGNLWLFTLLGGALIGLLALRKWRYATLLAIASSFFVMSPLLKESIQRPRPWTEGYQSIISPAGYSFPSGHALGSGLIIGGITLIAVMALRGRPLLQAMAGAAGLSVLGVIGASRVYLGAHWTSDVIAGYVLATLFLLLAFRIVRLGSRLTARTNG